MNDSLYNPDSMSKEDIKTLFVARQPLLDELVSTIRNQPNGAGVQHLLIIAPRGMGKTTMLLMVQFAVEDNNDLSKNWQAVRFPEESYDITELADFWLKVLRYLEDENLKPKIEEIEKQFTNSEDLREAAWALVKDWSKKHKKRIALLVDNFDMILSQIGSQTEQARLRDILMNDGTVMLIGCAPTYFHEIQDYEQPLYNFFKVHNLSDLKFPDIEELIRRRAEIDEIPNIEELLQKNKTRIKALEAFTGGNPRLVLMLYRIITSSDMTEVRNGLERLLDAVTPYYKDKTEKLPPQQRKIINEIAQYSLEKREGISPTEIAQRIRMTPNQVSTQLKRLSDNGYVKSLNIRGRSSFYVISEPLYIIWVQMRFGRNAREKRNWLVQILKEIYDVQEIQKEIEKLGERIKNFKLDGRDNKARGTLEYMLCLLETSTDLMQSNFLLAVESYLELKEISSIKLELNNERLAELTIDTLEKIYQEGVINEKKLNEAKSIKFLTEAQIIFNRAVDNQNDNLKALAEYEEVILLIEKVLDLDLDVLLTSLYVPLAIAYKHKGKVLVNIKRFEDADSSFNQSIKIFNQVNRENKKIAFLDILADTYAQKAFVLIATNRIDEALLQSNKAVEIYNKLSKDNGDEVLYWGNLIIAYLSNVSILIVSNKIDKAEGVLFDLLVLYKSSKEKDSIENLTSALAAVTSLGFSKNVREVIKKAKLEEIFFHLICAIDYVETKDETLIEKLSPEVRVVVEETIKTLQMIEEEKAKSETN